MTPLMRAITSGNGASSSVSMAPILRLRGRRTLEPDAIGACVTGLCDEGGRK
jgi:hypothetical protein